MLKHKEAELFALFQWRGFHGGTGWTLGLLESTKNDKHLTVMVTFCQGVGDLTQFICLLAGLFIYISQGLHIKPPMQFHKSCWKNEVWSRKDKHMCWTVWTLVGVCTQPRAILVGNICVSDTPVFQHSGWSFMRTVGTPTLFIATNAINNSHGLIFIDWPARINSS